MVEVDASLGYLLPLEAALGFSMVAHTRLVVATLIEMTMEKCPMTGHGWEICCVSTGCHWEISSLGGTL